MTPTMELRFVKRSEELMVDDSPTTWVRLILQQKWVEERHDLDVGFVHRALREEWRDVPVADAS